VYSDVLAGEPPGGDAGSGALVGLADALGNTLKQIGGRCDPAQVGFHRRKDAGLESRRNVSSQLKASR
jgi:hypothetical protein